MKILVTTNLLIRRLAYSHSDEWYSILESIAVETLLSMVNCDVLVLRRDVIFVRLERRLATINANHLNEGTMRWKMQKKSSNNCYFFSTAY